MRIAVLNCYLQKYWANTAEVESTARFAAAAMRMGIEVKAFARSEDLIDYDPDFVLSIAYNDAKLTGLPTYVLLTMPVRWIRDVPRFLRNVLSYDGYWAISAGVSSFVGRLFEGAGKPNLAAFAALSIGRTAFEPPDFSSARVAYLGTNWDGHRHSEVFKACSDLGVVKFHGNRARWSHLPASAFGGEVPFNGEAVLSTYRNAGIGLCFNHPDFDAEGIPTNRIFEVPAASAIIISTANALVRNTYGDAALYIDLEQPVQQIAEQIRQHVEWVRSHARQAAEMAEASHSAFNRLFCMERFLENAIELNERACDKLGYRKGRKGSRQPLIEPSVAYDFPVAVLVTVSDNSAAHLKRCLTTILNQTLLPRLIIVLDETKDGRVVKDVLPQSALPISLVRRSDNTAINDLLGACDKERKVSWLCSISADELLFPNHLYAVARAAHDYSEKVGSGQPKAVQTGLVQISRNSNLPEIMLDGSNVPRAEHMRIAQFCFDPKARANLSAFHPASVIRLIEDQEPPKSVFRSKSSEEIAFTGAITLATYDARQYPAYGSFTPPIVSR